MSLAKRLEKPEKAVKFFQIFIAITIVLLDLSSKYIFRSHGVYLENTGVSFGLFPGIGSWIWWLFCVVAVYFFIKKPTWALALMVCGGVANSLDRLIWGAVTDWIHIVVWFNIADVFVVLGAFLLIFNEIHANRL